VRDVFEILVEINEFVPRKRGDHERRLAADDLRQAIEEFYQPIEQAIAGYGRASVYRNRARDCIALDGYVISVHI
jgi:hypothetical protein